MELIEPTYNTFMRHETLNSIEDNKKNVATKISVATKYKFNILGSEAKQNLIESALKAKDRDNAYVAY